MFMSQVAEILYNLQSAFDSFPIKMLITLTFLNSLIIDGQPQMHLRTNIFVLQQTTNNRLE